MELKLRKIGNSLGVIIPKEHIKGYNIGDLITLEVITREDSPIKTEQVITKTGENKKLTFNVDKGIYE